MSTLLGQFSLNIAFYIYLIVYVPQIFHNRKTEHLKNLSLGMHYLFFIGYIFDLFYGFAYELQWQYKVVSIVSLFLIALQHIQVILYLHSKKHKLSFLIGHIVGLLFFIGAIVLFFRIETSLSQSITLIMGYISRLCFLFYYFPQIIKNKKLDTANALNKQFLYLSLMLCILDMISAWCLNWGWPNKLAGPFSFLCIIMLLWQSKKNQPLRADEST